jgi:hypothetical protein
VSILIADLGLVERANIPSLPILRRSSRCRFNARNGSSAGSEVMQAPVAWSGKRPLLQVAIAASGAPSPSAMPEGADVLIAYLNEDEDAAEVKTLVEREGRKAVLIPGDIRDPDHCRSVVRRAVQELGGVDILVNNAAHQATFKDIEDTTGEEWQETFETNVHAMFYLTKAAVPHMRPGAAIHQHSFGEFRHA